jgi:hypothetical protein
MDVHPPEPRRGELGGEGGQADAVRRHRDVAHARHPGDPGDDLEEIGAQRRLAAGQAELAKADRDGRPDDGLDLDRGEERGRRGEREPSSGMQYTQRRLQWSVSEMRK